MSQNPNDLESIFNEASSNAKQTTQIPTTQQTRRGNEIFAEENRVTEMSREEYAKREFGLEIPVDAVPLPSKGLVYPPNHPLHRAEFVEYKAMTTREEDILMSRALIKKGTVIKELIRSCLSDKSVKVESLLSGDQVALMIAIRSSGYGKEYNPTYTCPKCETKTDMHIDLDTLTLKNLPIEPIEIGTNLFEFILPVSGKKVLFKFTTVEDEEKMIQESESRRKRGMLNDNLVTTKLLSSIVSIDGISNRSDITKFVSYMPAKDSRALRKYMEENEPGVNMEVEFQCGACDHYDNHLALPMGSEFFWPNS
jgi:hypothetical protein